MNKLGHQLTNGTSTRTGNMRCSQFPSWRLPPLPAGKRSSPRGIFFHASYAGANVIPEDVLNQYVTSIGKPSFLTAVLSPFAAYTVKADLTFFNKTLHGKPLDIPALVLGGEASIAPVGLLKTLWGPALTNAVYGIIPQAGALVR